MHSILGTNWYDTTAILAVLSCTGTSSLNIQLEWTGYVNLLLEIAPALQCMHFPPDVKDNRM